MSVTADAVVTVFEIAEPVNVYDWIDAPDPADADTSSVTYDFYATWEHVNVTCTFNANGGSGAPNPITHWGGYSIDIPSTVPTRSGYTFVGWALSADATSASYYAGQQEVPLYGNVTLYAVWSPANSQIASVTSPIPIDGSKQGTLTITRYVSSYTHTVTIQLSSTYKLTFNNVGTSLSFTLPTSWLAGVPNATSAAVTVTVTTLNGSTQVGSSVSQTITATITWRPYLWISIGWKLMIGMKRILRMKHTPSIMQM